MLKIIVKPKHTTKNTYLYIHKLTKFLTVDYIDSRYRSHHRCSTPEHNVYIDIDTFTTYILVLLHVLVLLFSRTDRTHCVIGGFSNL